VITVTKPYLPSQENLNRYIQKIYDTKWITNNGPLVRELEKRLASYLGVKNLILVTNGTSALQVAYKVLDLKDEVITIPFSFVATTSTLVWNNLKPVFCDINKESLTIDTSKIETLITNSTSAIVATHVFGNGCEIDNIEKIARKYNLKTIYDAAHCFDVSYNNKNILNYGDISIISFHATKLFHTIEGGAIVTNDDDLAKKIRLSINFGITGPEQIETLGINAKMNEFQAAMGLAVLDDIDTIKKQRKYLWNYYKENIPKNLQIQKWNSNSTQNYAYFPILLKDEEILLKLENKLNQHDIYPRRYFNPSLNELDYIEYKSVCEVSEDISKRILVLPLYPDLSIEDAEKIVKIVRDNI
jgi:dTDP-4-amino-4,6-dideoxygalactose transaminase